MTPLRRAAAQVLPALSVLALLALFAILALGACDLGTWPKREAKTIPDVPVDSLRFLPPGSRFVLGDSATSVVFQGFHRGYQGFENGHACSRVLSMELVPRVGDSVPDGYYPSVSLRLPASGECAVDTVARDSVLTHVFPAGPDSVKLFGSRGGSTDSAQLVRGRFDSDSLVYDTSSVTRTTAKGRWLYRDASSGARAILFGDSLKACEFLNQAELVKLKDSTLVRFTWVTLDTCAGDLHSDSVDVRPARAKPASP